MLFDGVVISIICITIGLIIGIVYGIVKRYIDIVVMAVVFLIITMFIGWGMVFSTHCPKKEIFDSEPLKIVNTGYNIMVIYPDKSYKVLQNMKYNDEDIKIEKVVRYNVYNKKSIIYRVKE